MACWDLLFLLPQLHLPSPSVPHALLAILRRSPLIFHLQHFPCCPPVLAIIPDYPLPTLQHEIWVPPALCRYSLVTHRLLSGPLNRKHTSAIVHITPHCSSQQTFFFAKGQIVINILGLVGLRVLVATTQTCCCHLKARKKQVDVSLFLHNVTYKRKRQQVRCSPQTVVGWPQLCSYQLFICLSSSIACQFPKMRELVSFAFLFSASNLGLTHKKCLINSAHMKCGWINELISS